MKPFDPTRGTQRALTRRRLQMAAAEPCRRALTEPLERRRLLSTNQLSLLSASSPDGGERYFYSPDPAIDLPEALAEFRVETQNASRVEFRLGGQAVEDATAEVGSIPDRQVFAAEFDLSALGGELPLDVTAYGVGGDQIAVTYDIAQFNLDLVSLPGWVFDTNVTFVPTGWDEVDGYAFEVTMEHASVGVETPESFRAEVLDFELFDLSGLRTGVTVASSFSLQALPASTLQVRASDYELGVEAELLGYTFFDERVTGELIDAKVFGVDKTFPNGASVSGSVDLGGQLVPTFDTTMNWSGAGVDFSLTPNFEIAVPLGEVAVPVGPVPGLASAGVGVTLGATIGGVGSGPMLSVGLGLEAATGRIAPTDFLFSPEVTLGVTASGNFSVPDALVPIRIARGELAVTGEVTQGMRAAYESASGTIRIIEAGGDASVTGTATGNFLNWAPDAPIELFRWESPPWDLQRAPTPVTTPGAVRVIAGLPTLQGSFPLELSANEVDDFAFTLPGTAAPNSTIEVENGVADRMLVTVMKASTGEVVGAGQSGANGSVLYDLSGAERGRYVMRVERDSAERGNYTVHMDIDSGGGVAVVPVIDRSGSMNGQKIASARTSAATFAQLMQPGDHLGIVSFANSASTNFPLALVNEDGSTIQGALSAINGLRAGGGTSIFAGMLAGDNQLDTLPAGSVPRALIVMTDGLDNGFNLAAVDAAVDDDVRVFTIGFGANADQGLLNSIAERFGGQSYVAADGGDLQRIYTTLAGSIGGQTPLLNENGQIDLGQTVQHSVPVDGSVDQLTLGLNWGGSDLDLEIIAPDGSVYFDRNDPSIPVREGDEFVAGDTFEIFRVADPAPGDWTVNVLAVDVPNDQYEYNTYALGTSPIQTSVVTDRLAYAPGEAVRLRVALDEGAGQPITGATLGASISLRGSDAEPIRVDLFDDGRSFDGEANDGVYGTDFFGADEAGVYDVSVTATGEAAFGEQFTRTPVYSFTVQNAPGQPEIHLIGTNAIAIANGDVSPDEADGTSFGNASATAFAITRTFVVENRGLADLVLDATTPVTLDGDGAFELLNLPSDTIVPAGGTFAFDVRFNPDRSVTDAAADHVATLRITSNDADESVYEVQLAAQTSPRTVPVPTVRDGHLIAVGDAERNVVRVERVGDEIVLRVDAERTTFAAGEVRQVELDLGDGNDAFTMVGDVGHIIIRGGGGDDTISGDVGREAIYGGPGDDVINGGGAGDHLDGGEGGDLIAGDAGDDTLVGGLEGDTLSGGDGIDAVSYLASPEAVEVDLGAGSAWATADASRGDALVGNLEQILGTRFADRLVGDDGRNFINGLGGDDTVLGMGGKDTLLGGAGDDVLRGGDDNDLLVAMWASDGVNFGRDRLFGDGGFNLGLADDDDEDDRLQAVFGRVSDYLARLQRLA